MDQSGFFFFWWGGDKVIQEALTYENKCPFCKKKGPKYLIYLFTRYTMYSIIPFGSKKLRAIENHCPSCGARAELQGEEFESAKKAYYDLKEKENEED
jgi:hypothetical protein